MSHVAQGDCAGPLLVQRGRGMPRRARAERPLGGQWKLPLGAPADVSVRAEHRKCGAKKCSTCAEGPGHGPYLYAFWREGPKVKRKYLGRA